jgi:hypothetical protein
MSIRNLKPHIREHDATSPRILIDVQDKREVTFRLTHARPGAPYLRRVHGADPVVDNAFNTAT